jgi:putative protein-disulfide isomerase
MTMPSGSEAMACDASAGVCELPPAPARADAQSSSVTLVYVTDPLCSGCWALEPVWRKLRYYYGDALTVRNVYGGLLPGWDGFRDPGAGIAAAADVAPHWQEVAARTGQPIHPDVWRTDPPASSYPPSKAAHIVRMLEPGAEEAFLRRIREAIFLEARNIARAEVLVACAADVGVDTRAFSVLLDADAGARGLDADLRYRHALGVRRFPTVLVLAGSGAQPHVLPVVSRPWREVESALLAALGIPGARPAQAPSIGDALRAYRSGTALEFAELLGVTRQRAASELIAAGAVHHRFGPADHWLLERGRRCCPDR